MSINWLSKPWDKLVVKKENLELVYKNLERSKNIKESLVYSLSKDPNSLRKNLNEKIDDKINLSLQ